MDTTERILVVDEKTLEAVFLRVLERREKKDDLSDFEQDKLSKPAAAKFVGLAIPTFNKMVQAKRFKEYNLGARKYFLKSEILASLRTQLEEGKAAPYKPRTKPTIPGKKQA